MTTLLLPYGNDELRTATVINRQWLYDAATLASIPASRVVGQFRTHLNRAGVLSLPGPFLAILHGEFDPGARLFQLHFHIVTLEVKAEALHNLKSQPGYERTRTGSAPIRVDQVRDRTTQLSYLAKAFWPSRPIVQIDGRTKRVRDPRRIPEPYGTQVLLWLDKHRFRDIVLTSDIWSPRKGGSEAARALYLVVHDGI